MLEIVKFIKEHDNWRELLSNDPYNLKIAEDDGFVILSYSQINSDFHEEICKEARGLILDMQNDFKVVRMAFKKFFNLGEGFAANIDWDSAVATEKIDGSIMSVWFARGKWHLSTNNTIDTFKAHISGIAPYKTYGELFESVLPLSTFEHFNKNFCWTFELVSPYNKVVIDYPETKVYLLSIRDMSTLEEFSLFHIEVLADANGFNIPKVYHLNNEKDYRNLVNSMPEGHEGIVVRDKNNERVKIKTLLYFSLHHSKNNGVLTEERIVKLIRENDHHEFLAYFPEYKGIFYDVETQINNAYQVIENAKVEVQDWKENHPCENGDRENRKLFAQEFSKNKYNAVYFLAYNGTLDYELETMSIAKFIRIFRIKIKEDETT